MIAGLRDACRGLLDAAAGRFTEPPAGEWSAGQILAHVSIVSAVTIGAVSAVAAGEHTTYDNRVAQDRWTLSRIIELAGGSAGLRERIHRQGEALCTLTSALSEAELDTPVPARLVSGDAVLVDRPLPLRDLITGLAETELPGHTKQLLALRSG
ncbi:DinB family protein [Amycolatopsis thermalba]|uniref:DinB family protein n=1 Tax=Amycolatopsis thermalba TaxID=944492 RepID=A0ABY4NX02_9PSEU|nr:MULTISPECIES: DinB family protein [Amycolatopsis]UQS24590.1 DinB family protein [Amycolatopsis thermalba]